MRRVKPINTDVSGCSYTIRARYDGACLRTLTSGGGVFAATGVVEIEDVVTTGYKKLDEMLPKVLKTIHVGSKCWVDCFMGRCVYEDVAPALRTRSVADCNDWIVEAYEEDTDTDRQ